MGKLPYFNELLMDLSEKNANLRGWKYQKAVDTRKELLGYFSQLDAHAYVLRGGEAMIGWGRGKEGVLREPWDHH